MRPNWPMVAVPRAREIGHGKRPSQPVFCLRMDNAEKPEYHKGQEPGLGNPRWARYHRMISAPELFDGDAVAKALARARVQQARQEAAQTPLERPVRRHDDLHDSSGSR